MKILYEVPIKNKNTDQVIAMLQVFSDGHVKLIKRSAEFNKYKEELISERKEVDNPTPIDHLSSWCSPEDFMGVIADFSTPNYVVFSLSPK